MTAAEPTETSLHSGPSGTPSASPARSLKERAKTPIFKLLKRRPLEGMMAEATRNAPLAVQGVLRKMIPQPYSYRPDEVRRVIRHALQWRLNPSDYFQWHQYFGLSDEVLEVLLAEARHAEVVFDVGANIGFYSVLMAANMPPGGQVFAFEPNPTTYERLVAHQSMNRIRNIVTLPVALAQTPGRQRLYDFGEGEAGKFSLRDPNSATAHGSIDVKVESLDSVAEHQGLKRLDLIKIDVEGLEPQVLLGAKNTIQNFKPNLCFEFTPHWVAEVPFPFEWLLEQGYRFYRVSVGPSGHPVLVAITVTDGFISAEGENQINLFALAPGRTPTAPVRD